MNPNELIKVMNECEELEDELEEMTRERNIWRATCAIGFVIFVLLGYFGFW